MKLVNKNILITGSNGFLGKEIKKSLCGNNLFFMGRDSSSDYFFDFQSNTHIPDELPRFDVVIHIAGLAHNKPGNHFQVNSKGTQNLLASLSSNPPRAFLFISTVAVYGVSSGLNIDENHPLNATDSYGLSKIMAEKSVLEWSANNTTKVSILRLPLVVSENPPGNLGAMIHGIKSGNYFRIGGGYAKKSMVCGEDIAKIIPKLAEVGGIYNLTDGKHPSFRELDVAIQEKYGIKRRIRNIPYLIAKFVVVLGDVLEGTLGKPMPINSTKLQKITSSLTFSDEKARREIGWNPTSVIEYYNQK